MLVLGGSWFVGRVLVESASARGHDVTTFNRGLASVRPPAGVRHVKGNRESTADLRSLAQQGPWDAVVDVSGSVPAWVRRSAELLAPVADHYTFISTVSVYRFWPHVPVDEESQLWDGSPDDDPPSRRWDPDAYGPLKVGCEMACAAALGGERLLTLRPHVVLGPYEYVGRLPWWLMRMRRGGKVLAPGPDRGIQPVDARDLSDFLLNQIERRTVGIYNVAPRVSQASYGELLRACSDVVPSPRRPVTLVWADEDWLVSQGVTQWTELPLWRNAAAPWSMNTERAQAAGLRCRPLAETVKDTWTWLAHGGLPIAHERAGEHGIEADREEALIANWLAAQRQR